MDDSILSRKALSQPVRILLMILGTLAVIIAMIGVFVPVLPTTVFLLLAAAAYSRSSDRFYHWLLDNRIFGSYIRNYREGRGIMLRHKLLTMLLLWSMIGTSAYFIVDVFWVKLLLLAIAVGVSIHILSVKTTIEPQKTNSNFLSACPDCEEI